MSLVFTSSSGSPTGDIRKVCNETGSGAAQRRFGGSGKKNDVRSAYSG